MPPTHLIWVSRDSPPRPRHCRAAAQSSLPLSSSSWSWRCREAQGLKRGNPCVHLVPGTIRRTHLVQTLAHNIYFIIDSVIQVFICSTTFTKCYCPASSVSSCTPKEAAHSSQPCPTAILPIARVLQMRSPLPLPVLPPTLPDFGSPTAATSLYHLHVTNTHTTLTLQTSKARPEK